jgi:glucose-6-phosphate isomerase
METMTNANTAREWFLKETSAGNDAVAKHFVAVSTNRSAVEKFGIEPEGGMFGFWDWVGGRYSVWSAVGLSLACSIGFENFTKFLSGARFVDEKFRNEPLKNNIPAIMALIGIWYRNGYGRPDLGVFPYEQYLSRFPAYLQQLDMESNGKSVNKSGVALTTYQTGPVVWGEPGTNGQHSFFQKLHQGTDFTPSDFIFFRKSLHPIGSHHKKLLANCFGQTEALMKGKGLETVKYELKSRNASEEEISRVAASKVFSGNRPSNTIGMEILTPESLGALIAIYEHKVYVQGVIWDVNSFDQMGVELGKQEATVLEPLLEPGADISGLNSSTKALIQWFKGN